MNIFGLFAVLSTMFSSDVATVHVAPGEPSSSILNQELQTTTPPGSVLGYEVDNVSSYGNKFHGTLPYPIFCCCCRYWFESTLSQCVYIRFFLEVVFPRSNY
jgi:hypothetical protein